MNKILLAALLVFTLPLFSPAAEPNVAQFDVICRTAKDMDQSSDGRAYEPVFADAISTELGKTMKACTAHATAPYTVNLVFVIGGNGKVEHIFAEPGHEISTCVASKLTGMKLPKPPKNDWLLLVNINIRQ